MDQRKLADIVAKAKLFLAGEGLGGLSSHEQLMVGLIVNRADLIGMHGYTMAQVVEVLDQEWLAIIPEASRQVLGADPYRRKLYGEDFKN